VIAALIAFLVACNPAAALVALAHDRRTDRPLPVVAGAVAALTALVVAAALSDSILDVLDINLGTYRVGAGAVLVVSGLRWLFAGAPRDAIEPETDLRLAGFIAFPTLLTPAAAVLAISVGAEDGTATVAVAAGIAITLGALGVYLRRSVPVALATAGVRLIGAGTIIVGVGLIIDGLRTL
jgi:small neutral amino acid transporter SnatA (MarC family)